MKNLEDHLQACCVQWFRAQYPQKIIMAIPNGGKRHIGTAMRLKKTGVLSGCPDLLIPHASNGFHGFFIEMKAPGKRSKTSPAQKTVIAKLLEEGYLVEVIDDFKDFVDAVKGYMS